MVDAKSLLAGVVLALVGAVAAAADNPTVRISHADQLKAEAALLALKDFRLVALLPIIAAILFVVAPAPVTKRFQSLFDLTASAGRSADPGARDREQRSILRPLHA